MTDVDPGPGLTAWVVFELGWGGESIFLVETAIRAGKE